MYFQITAKYTVIYAATCSGRKLRPKHVEAFKTTVVLCS